MIKNKLKRIFLNLLIAIIIGLIVFLPIELFFEILRPSIDNKGNTLMPIGSIIYSILISVIISILTFTILMIKFYKNKTTANKKYT